VNAIAAQEAKTSLWIDASSIRTAVSGFHLVRIVKR
jgi:hypothetical protein